MWGQQLRKNAKGKNAGGDGVFASGSTMQTEMPVFEQQRDGGVILNKIK